MILYHDMDSARRSWGKSNRDPEISCRVIGLLEEMTDHKKRIHDHHQSPILVSDVPWYFEHSDVKSSGRKVDRAAGI